MKGGIISNPTTTVEDEARRAARKRAIERLSEELQLPEHLSKVEAIRDRHMNKKLSLETQLKNLVSSQLKEAKDGIEKLATSIKLLAKLKKDTTGVHTLALETHGLIPYYEMIQEVNITRNNLNQTKEKLIIFMSIPNKVVKIRKLMRDPINILKAHVEVRKLEKERDEVLKQAERFPEHQSELKDIFHDVDELSDELDEVVYMLIGDHVELAKKRPAVLIKVLQIIFRENRQRELFIAANPSLPAPERDYLTDCKEKLCLSIRETILVTFKDCRNEETMEYDTKKFVRASKALIDLIETVVDDVQKCFPENIDIIRIYVDTYGDCFFDLLREISKSAAESANPVNDCMLMVKWIKTYYEPQLKRLGFPVDRDLMESLDILIEAYREHVYQSIDELSTRIIKMDRDSPPEIMEDILYTLAPITLFNIIQTYISLAQKCGSQIMVLFTLDEIKKSLLKYQDKFARDLENNGKQYEIAYVVAQINNNNKCYEYTTEIQEVCNQLGEYIDEVNFDDVLDGFQSLLKMSRQVLLNLCFRVLEDDFHKLFTKSWYEEDTAEIIIATLNDYFSNEIKGKLMESYFRKFSLECLDFIIDNYVTHLLSNSASFTKSTGERLNAEVSRITSFFISWQVNEKFVTSHAQVLLDFAQLLNATQSEMTKVLTQFVKNSMDLTPSIVETVLILRDDIDRKEVTSIMEVFKKIHENIVTGPPPSDGIFARLKLLKTKPRT